MRMEMELLTGFIVFKDESKRRRKNERQNFRSIAESWTQFYASDRNPSGSGTPARSGKLVYQCNHD